MFSEKLKELRESKNLSQYELAEIIHVSRAAISKWEIGNGLPSDVNLESLCKYFDVSEDALIGYGDYKKEIKEIMNKNTLFLLSGIGILLMISFIVLSLIPIYYFRPSFSSFRPENESIISAVDVLGVFPILTYSITGCISVLFLFDFVKISIKKKKTLILSMILLSVLLFIIYFVLSYLIVKDKNFSLFYLF